MATIIELLKQNPESDPDRFADQLKQLSPEEQIQLLGDRNLAEYRTFIWQTIERGRYRLDPVSEQVLAHQKQIFHQQYLDLEQSIRRQTQAGSKDYLQILADHANFAQSELVGRVRAWAKEDELRGRALPYTKILVESGLPETFLDEMNSIVNTMAPYFAGRFQELQKGLPPGFDRLEKRFTLNESIEIIREGFASIDRLEFIDRLIDRGQIIFHPDPNKFSIGHVKGGSDENIMVQLGFAAGDPDLPIHPPHPILVGFHELGHALDSHLSNKQPIPIYRHHWVARSEAPSFLMEKVGRPFIAQHLDEDDRQVFRYQQIRSSMHSIFGLNNYLNFEIELHRRAREGGDLSTEALVAMWKQYTGQLHGYGWINMVHLRSFFCNYCYIFGQLQARYLHLRYQQDSTFWQQIEEYLGAGTSLPPIEILRKIGIEVNDNFWAESFTGLEDEIVEFEKQLNLK